MTGTDRDDLREGIHEMGPDRFARFVADAWSRVLGWETRVVGRPGDRGADVLAAHEGDRRLVQAKRYAPGTAIDAPEVRQYASLRLEADGVGGVTVVTTGAFSPAAREAAADLPVVLVDGEALLDLLVEYDAEGLVAAYGGDAAPAGGEGVGAGGAGSGEGADAPAGDPRDRLAAVLEDDEGPLARLRSWLGLG